MIRTDFLRSFLRRHLVGKPVVASPNVGCFPAPFAKSFHDRSITEAWCHELPVYKRTGFDGSPISPGDHKSLGICSLSCYHTNTTCILPWQVFPSPAYPALQVQMYDPRVLEQLALMSHTGEEAPHSSMSRTTNILIDGKNFEGH